MYPVTKNYLKVFYSVIPFFLLSTMQKTMRKEFIFQIYCVINWSKKWVPITVAEGKKESQVESRMKKRRSLHPGVFTVPYLQ